MRGITSGGMPGPSSAIVISTVAVAGRGADVDRPAAARSPIAWAALVTRFMNT